MSDAVTRQKTCCICEGVFTGFGCNPDPFDGEVGMCCQTCDERFVIPVRLIWGRSGNGAPLVMLKNLAAVGASIAYTNQMGRELLAARQRGEMDESRDV